MVPFSERLREIRDNKGLTQLDLAEKVGVSQAAISQLEAGRRSPTPAMIKRLAIALEVEPRLLVGQDEAAFEREILMRNLQELSPEALRKINDLVEFLKKGRR